MADFPTSNDLFRVARDEVLARNTALTREIVEKAGSDANALTAAGVAVGDVIVGQLIRVAAALLIGSAKGSDLDRILFDRFQLLRKDASPALGEVQISSPTVTVSSFAIPSGTQFRTTDGKVFASTAARTFPAGSTGPVTVPVASVLAGSSQQARIGTITSLTDTLSGAPAGLTVTNAAATAGADDAEEDEDYRARGQQIFRTRFRGTLPAIETQAKAIPGVRKATAFEVIEATGSPARIVELVVADAFTEQLIDAAALPISYETQAETLANQVRASLLDTRAAGINVIVTVANVILVGVTLGLRFRPSVDVEATSQAARAATVSYVNSLAPGESFIVADLVEALSVVPGLQVLGGEVLSPTLDQTTTPAGVFRTSVGLVTISGQS